MERDTWRKTPGEYTRRAVAGIAAVALLSSSADVHAARVEASDPMPVGVVAETARVVAWDTAPNMAELATTWADLMATRKRETGNPNLKIDIAAMDMNTGQAVQYQDLGESPSPEDQRFYTASIMKLSLLVELLRRDQAAGLSVDDCTTSDRLSAHCQQLDLAYPMITVSDNATASQLYVALGGASGMQSFFDRIGATGTTASSSWGVTTTTAADQLKVVRAAVTPGYVLSAEYVDKARELMGQVTSEQRWGVSGGVPVGDAAYYLKNGWIPDLRTTINSIGYVVSDDGATRYLVAVLTRDHGSQGEAVETIERASNATYQLLTHD